MNVVVLTTDTTHHCHFVRELSKKHNVTVVSETISVSAPFETGCSWQNLVSKYESKTWFGGHSPKLEDFAEVTVCESVNQPEVVETINRMAPDLVFSFGVGRMRSEIISALGEKLLNLHGGNPEEYRGLDSHLWAIYHREFDQLVTALHSVDLELDTGDIVGIQKIDIPPGSTIEQLRLHNTQVCVDLCTNAIDSLESSGTISRVPQKKRGRYYGHMPGCLKDLAAQRFKRNFDA